MYEIIFLDLTEFSGNYSIENLEKGNKMLNFCFRVLLYTKESNFAVSFKHSRVSWFVVNASGCFYVGNY